MKSALKALIFLPFFSGPAVAADLKCGLSEAQLKEQASAFASRFAERIGKELTVRESAYKSIDVHHGLLEVGTIPNDRAVNFYALIPVDVIFIGFTLHIQTSLYTGEQTPPLVQKGLWFPLAVANGDENQPCRLVLIFLRDGEQKYLPKVELVIGDPPRIAAPDLVQVVEIESAPAQEPAAIAPVPPPAPAPAAKPSPPPATVKSKGEARRESREIRRRDARKAREQRRRAPRRRQRIEKSQPEQPAKSAECQGDISPWKKALCAISGN